MANFERLFKSSAFLSVLKNNIILSVMDICIVFPAPIILALSINEVKINGKTRGTVDYLSSSFYFLGGGRRIVLYVFSLSAQAL